MSFFKNLFGKKKTEPPVAPVVRPHTPATLPPIKGQPAPSTSVPPASNKEMIQVFDAYGRELLITKEAWRTSVLPGTLKTNWNNPDLLYGVIFGALKDGFRSDIIAAAEQLYKIDSQPERGTCVWGIVLREEGRLDESEKVLRDYIAKHGENGSVLTNLAKVYSQRKNEKKSEETLWHALEVDPNQENGLGWYWIIHKERNGEAGGLEALRRIAVLPGSWRAQLWIAREALQTRRQEEALALYQECLARIAKPVPTDFLTQMSGDLGNTGHLPELLRFTEPHFVVKTHGLQVGNNLIKAHLELAQYDAARRIVDQLYALKRLDWQKTLSFWETEIAKARIAVEKPDPKKKLNVSLLTIDGPVWLKPNSPAAELFPAKTPDDLTVCFLCGTAEKATNSKRTEHQLADTAGRLTRALPLFLAEQVDFQSRARVQTLIPWIVDETCGFVLGGVPWSDENAVAYASQSPTKNDYVVSIHFKTQTEPWNLELRLMRTIDGKCLGNLNVVFPSTKPEDAIPQLAQQLLGLLAEQAEVEIQTPPSLYQVPVGPHFPYYLLRLEQLLSVRCASIDGVQPNFLSGVRDIIDGNIQQCLNCPQNIPARLLLVQTLSYMKRVRPEILPEFKEKLALLQKEKPLSEPAQGVVQRMFNEVLEG